MYLEIRTVYLVPKQAGREQCLLMWPVPQWRLFKTLSTSVICSLVSSFVYRWLCFSWIEAIRVLGIKHISVKPLFIHFLLFVSKAAHLTPLACSHVGLLHYSKHHHVVVLPGSECSFFPRSSLPRLGNSRLTLQGTCLFHFQLGLRPNAKLGCWPGDTNGTLCIAWESWPLAHVLPCGTIQALLALLFISDPQRSKSVFLLFSEWVILALSS